MLFLGETRVELSLAEAVPLWRTLRDEGVTALITPALAAIMNAVVDALSVHGIVHMDMPATPARVWAAIAAATRKVGAE